jgi:DNA-binding NtrC family response regulator
LDCSVGVLRLDHNSDATQISALERLMEQDDREWIALLPSALATEPDVKRLIANYCFDYLSFPVDSHRVVATLGHAYGMAALRRNGTLRDCGRPGGAEQRIVGDSPAAMALRQAIANLAGSRGPVLIAGEHGSGKRLAAQAIHEASERAPGPFVTLNCAAISPELRRVELLGCEQAAYGSASGHYVGRIEAAAGGTLFLDEVGELPRDLQGELLGFLQQGEIRRIGGTQTLRPDVRVLAASPTSLREAVAAGRFRADLLKALDVLQLQVPPLRERRGDIEGMAQRFLREYRPESRRAPRAFTPQARAALRRHSWPGNVGELANRVRRAVVMGEGRLVSSADLGLDALDQLPSPPTLEAARDEAERRILLEALDRHRGNVTRAARELDVSRVTLYRLLDKHRIRGEKPPVPEPTA